MYDKYKDTTYYLPGIFISIIFSSYSYYLYNSQNWLALLCASLFIVSVYIFKKEFLPIALVFFTVGIFINAIYYGYLPREEMIIRISKITPYEIQGKGKGRLIILNGDLKGVIVGDRVEVVGEFTRELNKLTGVVGIYNISNYKVLPGDIISKIFSLRVKIFSKIEEKLGRRRAALVSSIAFGYGDYLDKEDKGIMKELGVLHAISVSGLHLALIYTLIKKISNNKLAIIISLIYVIFTGAISATIRAFIMLLILNLAPILKRNYNGIASLSLAAIVIFIIKPYEIFSVGFLLSFSATLGIIVFNKKLNKKLYKLPRVLRESLSITLASQIYSFPIMIMVFNEFSLNLIWGNLILAPFITAIVFIGNILVLTSFIPSVFSYLSFITFYITYALDKVIEYIAIVKIPIITVNEMIWVIYIWILFAIYFYKKGYKNAIYLPVVALMFLKLFSYSPYADIKYYKEGAYLIRYKWESVILAVKENADIEKVKKVSLVERSYLSYGRVRIGEDIVIERIGQNLLINKNNRRYLLQTIKGKSYLGYDIIDFENNKNNEVLILDNKVITID